MTKLINVISLLLCCFIAFGFSIKPPKEFEAMSSEGRIYVLEQTWRHRQQIIKEIKNEGYENAQEEFFHVFHQMLLIDNRLSTNPIK